MFYFYFIFCRFFIWIEDERQSFNFQESRLDGIPATAEQFTFRCDIRSNAWTAEKLRDKRKVCLWNFFFNTIFVSSHMYPENPEGTQVIVGSMNMGYLSGTARNRTHNLFHPKLEPIPLGHSDVNWDPDLILQMLSFSLDINRNRNEYMW